jgi:ankyrin repeat protein
MILSILHHNEHVRDHFQSCWNDPKFIGIPTGNPIRRRLFRAVLEDISIGTWLATTTNLLFILLDKKECKLVKKFFHVSPSLIHRLDNDGNDPLLYVCLKVRGCRERLIEYLIRIGCDVQRRNSKDEDFIDALQLTRNRKLLQKLIEQEIVRIDENSGEIKINSIKLS